MFLHIFWHQSDSILFQICYNLTKFICYMESHQEKFTFDCIWESKGCSCISLCSIFRKDSFKVICGTSLGRLTKIRIGHDNSGLGPGWFLNKVSSFDNSHRVDVYNTKK